MPSLNQVTLIGYVGDEPKAATTKNGKAMTALSLATTEKGYTKQDGTKAEDKTEWHNVVFFGKSAEVIQKYVGKGSLLFIQGKLHTRSYEDKDKVTRYVTEIVGEQFQMLDKRANSSQPQPGVTAVAEEPVAPVPMYDVTEDLPF